MAKYSAKAQEKVRENMHEMKEGKLKSGRNGKKGNQSKTGRCYRVIRGP